MFHNLIVQNGYTALMKASLEGHIYAVKCHIQAEADMEILDFDVRHILFLAYAFASEELAWRSQSWLPRLYQPRKINLYSSETGIAYLQPSLFVLRVFPCQPINTGRMAIPLSPSLLVLAMAP